MKSNEVDVQSAMNLTLIPDAKTNYFPNFPAGILNDRHLLTASRILCNENCDIKLNFD
jgi:hypothetical protein